jgi:prephenate dehydrogenase
LSADILTGCVADANRDRLQRSLNDAISARRRPVQKADVIIYAVTAASSLDAAKSVKPQLSDAPYFLDLNWVSPAKGQIGKEVRRTLGRS